MDSKLTPRPLSAPGSGRRSYWLKTLHNWHWISSAMCLVGMLLFSITGLTLNNAGLIESKPSVVSKQATLPAELLQLTKTQAAANVKSAPLPAAVAVWLESQWAINAKGKDAEWSADEAYLSLPRPGGDAWLRVDIESGDTEYELTDRGWVSYFNDLHKGRHTGTAWSWFLDIFAAATLVFSLTGLFILKMHSNNRPLTWPLVGAGLVIPLLLAMLLMH